MVCLHRQKFHTPNLYTIRVCNGIYVSVAMSQRVGRIKRGRKGGRERDTHGKEGGKKEGREEYKVGRKEGEKGGRREL